MARSWGIRWKMMWKGLNFEGLSRVFNFPPKDFVLAIHPGKKKREKISFENQQKNRKKTLRKIWSKSILVEIDKNKTSNESWSKKIYYNFFLSPFSLASEEEKNRKKIFPKKNPKILSQEFCPSNKFLCHLKIGMDHREKRKAWWKNFMNFRYQKLFSVAEDSETKVCDKVLKIFFDSDDKSWNPLVTNSGFSWRYLPKWTSIQILNFELFFLNSFSFQVRQRF